MVAATRRRSMSRFARRAGWLASARRSIAHNVPFASFVPFCPGSLATPFHARPIATTNLTLALRSARLPLSRLAHCYSPTRRRTRHRLAPEMHRRPLLVFSALCTLAALTIALHARISLNPSPHGCHSPTHHHDHRWLHFIPSHPLYRSPQKLNSLRAEADAAIERAEEAESKNKRLEQESLQKEQEITSLQHKLNVMESDLEKAEAKLQDHKANKEEEDSSKSNVDSLQRKVSMLEEDLDQTEKKLRETTEQCVARERGLLTPVFLAMWVSDRSSTPFYRTGCARWMSRLSTLRSKSRVSSRSAISGSASSRRRKTSTTRRSGSSTRSSSRWRVFKEDVAPAKREMESVWAARLLVACVLAAFCRCTRGQGSALLVRKADATDDDKNRERRKSKAVPFLHQLRHMPKWMIRWPALPPDMRTRHRPGSAASLPPLCSPLPAS